jgi:hydroxypyruvate isomerase
MGLRFAANLDRFWAEQPIRDRFDEAAAHGFDLVEFLYPHDEVQAVDDALTSSGVRISLFNTGVGQRSAGDKGILTIPGREDDFAACLESDLRLANRWGVTQLHAVGGVPRATDRGTAAVATAVSNLRRVADVVHVAGVTVHVEFINSIDAPGFGVPSLEAAVDIVNAVDHPAVRLQFDQYHVAVSGLDPVEEFSRYQDLIAYVQIADTEGRHEPLPGSEAVPGFLRALEARGYEGVIGLEYDPRGDTAVGIEWLRDWR